MMLAMGDALALVVSRKKDFTPQKFAVLHPGGSLGAQLKQVHEIMRTKPDLRRVESGRVGAQDLVPAWRGNPG